MKIAVFLGGSSEERAVSLKSGQAVYQALCERYPGTAMYDVEWAGKRTLFDAVAECVEQGTEVVFNILHGGLGENGGVQGILEAAGLRYTGSGIGASALAMDKDKSKALFRAHDIPTADWLTGEAHDMTVGKVDASVGFPCIVKPVDQGSSVGVIMVENASALPGAVREVAAFGSGIMAETFIPGSELSVPILGDTPLPVIEIRPRHAIYDYECKYTAGMSEYCVPAPISDELAQKVQALALKAFKVLGLRDIARIDFRLDAGGEPLCFEANTLPGMTATSLVPKSAACAGIDFEELVSRIACHAFERKGSR